MTTLYCHQFRENISRIDFEPKLSLLTKDQQEKIRKFRSPADAYASLAGKLLLLEGLRAFKISDTLSDLKHSYYGKPYLEDRSVSFSISHSGNYVCCILSTDTSAIGVDIEEMRYVNIPDFKNIWSSSEWNEIETNGLPVFYRYWTRKEAVIKAEGSGLSIPLQNIEIQPSYALLQNKVYHLTEVSFKSNVMISVASLDEVKNMNTITINTL